jgi:hypothetical protein
MYLPAVPSHLSGNSLLVVPSVCRLVDGTWKLGGPAGTTISFLREMYHHVEGGRELVEKLFDGIREGD